MRSISSGGQPWKVDSVSVSRERGGKSRSRKRAELGRDLRRSRSTIGGASFMPAMNACTRSRRMPARS